MVTVDELADRLDDRQEPDVPRLDPRVVLDTNIEGQAWLWHTRNESEGYLVYEGEVEEIER